MDFDKQMALILGSLSGDELRRIVGHVPRECWSGLAEGMGAMVANGGSIPAGTLERLLCGYFAGYVGDKTFTDWGKDIEGGEWSRITGQINDLSRTVVSLADVVKTRRRERAAKESKRKEKTV